MSNNTSGYVPNDEEIIITDKKLTQKLNDLRAADSLSSEPIHYYVLTEQGVIAISAALIMNKIPLPGQPVSNEKDAVCVLVPMHLMELATQIVERDKPEILPMDEKNKLN